MTMPDELPTVIALEELSRCYARIDHLTERMFELRDALEEIKEFAEERHDVLDGEDGKPRPNDWMKVTQLCEEVLEDKP